MTPVVVDYMKKEGTELLNKAKVHAEDYADKKLKEYLDKKLAVLNEQLGEYKVKHPVTGDLVPAKWEFFDENKDGELSVSEELSIGMFVGKENAKAVAQGEISASEAAQRTKDVGGTLGVIGALYAGTKGVAYIRRKKFGGTDAEPKPSEEPTKA